MYKQVHYEGQLKGLAILYDLDYCSNLVLKLLLCKYKTSGSMVKFCVHDRKMLKIMHEKSDSVECNNYNLKKNG